MPYGIWNKNTGGIRNIVAGKRRYRSSFCEEEADDAIPVVFGTSIEKLDGYTKAASNKACELNTDSEVITLSRVNIGECSTTDEGCQHRYG